MQFLAIGGRRWLLTIHIHAYTCLVGVVGGTRQEPKEWANRFWMIYVGPLQITHRVFVEASRQMEPWFIGMR